MDEGSPARNRMDQATGPRLIVLLWISAISPGLWSGEAERKIPDRKIKVSANSNGSPLDPTTAKSAKEFEHLKGYKLDEKQRAIKEVTLVGAITALSKERMGFQPLLQHHMAVEHWFVSGLERKDVAAKLGKKGRCFVRVRGRRELKKVFGGPPLDMIGNGLRKSAPGVMGYHERVYEFKIKEVLWIKTEPEFEALQRHCARLAAQLSRALQEQSYQEANGLLRSSLSVMEETGLFLHPSPKYIHFFVQDMLLLKKEPTEWEAADRKRASDALLRSASSEWPYDCERVGKRILKERSNAWPESIRHEVAAETIPKYRGLEYRFQKKEILGHLERLGGPKVDTLKKEIAEDQAQLNQFQKNLPELISKHDYKGIKRIWEASVPLQALLLDKYFDKKKRELILKHLQPCLAIEQGWDQADKRVLLLQGLMRQALTPTEWGYPSLPSTYHKPNLAEELATHFLPRLEQREREALETFLIEFAKTLDPKEHQDSIGMLSEMLTGVAGEKGQAFLERLIERYEKAKNAKWRIEKLRKHLDSIKKAMR